MEFQLFGYKEFTCYENMAIDEFLLTNLKDKPIIRFYGWKPSITIGRYTNIVGLIDLDILKNSGIGYSRRLTGGGILTHHIDLSYSIFLPKRYIKNRGVKENYRYICSFLIDIYKKLGLDAKFANEIGFNPIKSDICLAGLEEYDIVINGKKIGGNAQRYTKRAVLQHGSIPLWIDESLFKPIFLESSGIKNTQSLRKLRIDITLEELLELAKNSFKKTFNVNFFESEFNSSQKEEINRLIKGKYSNDNWNLKGIENDR